MCYDSTVFAQSFNMSGGRAFCKSHVGLGQGWGPWGWAVVAQSNLIAACTGKTGCVMITEGILPKTSYRSYHEGNWEDSEAYRESRSGGKLELLQVAYFQDFDRSSEICEMTRRRSVITVASQ